MAIKLPDALLEDAEKGRCILFVGSGLSNMAGYPNWSQLIDQLVIEARRTPQAKTTGLAKLVRARDYLMLAEFARSTLGPAKFATVLKRQLGGSIDPSPAHKIIANTAYRGFITTNYDRLLETTLTIERGWSQNVITHEAITSLATALYEPDPFLFKLHGDIMVPDTIVLTSRDYDRIILRSPHVRNFLQACFLTYTLLFVGYSLRDPDFNLALRELHLIFEGQTPVHYALLPDVPAFGTEHLLQAMNIQTIPYKARGNNHQAVDEALDQIAGVAPWKPHTP
jgi:hypothetical protein